MIVDYSISFPAEAYVVVEIGDARYSLRQLASKVSCNKTWCTYYFAELDMLMLRADKCKVFVVKPSMRQHEMTCREFIKYIMFLNGDVE
jgi:hypothetical protein